MLTKFEQKLRLNFLQFHCMHALEMINRATVLVKVLRQYRGIIEPTRRQYSHLGDAATMTDNRPYNAKDMGLTFLELHTNNNLPNGTSRISGEANAPDDRWVFTENNPRRDWKLQQLWPLRRVCSKVLMTHSLMIA
jgi:hypothetical protein